MPKTDLLKVNDKIFECVCVSTLCALLSSNAALPSRELVVFLVSVFMSVSEWTLVAAVSWTAHTPLSTVCTLVSVY